MVPELVIAGVALFCGAVIFAIEVVERRFW